MLLGRTVTREDLEEIRREWVPMFTSIRHTNRRYYENLTFVISNSKKFLRILSQSTSSTLYTSYSDLLKDTVKEIFRVLIADISELCTHKCINELYYQCKNLLEGQAEAFVAGCLQLGEESLTFHLLDTVYMVLANTTLSKNRVLLGSIAGKVLSLGNLEGERRRVVVMILLEEYKEVGDRKHLEGMYREKERWLFMDKVYPVFVSREPPSYLYKILPFLLLLDGSLSARASLAPIKAIPEDTLKTLGNEFKKKIIFFIFNYALTSNPNDSNTPRSAQSLSLELRTGEALDALVYLCRHVIPFSIFLKFINSIRYTPTVLYKVSSALIELSPLHRYSAKDVSSILEQLYSGTDSLKIQYCRVMYGVEPDIPSLVSLLVRSKNIRVKWNALRVLELHRLSEEEVERVVEVFNGSKNHKIMILCLKVMVRNGECARGLRTKIREVEVEKEAGESPYAEELREIYEKVVEGEGEGEEERRKNKKWQG